MCIFCLACGARTGLKAEPGEDLDAGRDVGIRDVGRDISLLDTSSDIVLANDAFPDAPPPNECVPFDALAGGADLDIFVLMDSSASMDRRVVLGPSKKDAVANAVEAFVYEESSRGLGVSLTFFPFDDSNYPVECSSNEACDGARCILGGVCQGSGPQTTCEHEEDCHAGQRCELTGACLGGYPFAGACVEGDFCRPEPATPCRLNGRCENPPLCGVGSYLAPAVPVSTLPGAALPMVHALRRREPGGTTPTLPALQGIIEQALARSIRHPERNVVVLVATDGLPSSCDTSAQPGEPATAIVGPERVAAEGVANGIFTYVIGVFEGFEEASARENLSRLAVAGGTGEATIISTESAVSEELLEELNRLRRSLQTCAYAIPAPGTLPRPEDVRVRLVRGTDEDEVMIQELVPVGDASICDEAIGGFYFREDGAARPSVVELCPSSCALGLEPDVRVRIDAICTE